MNERVLVTGGSGKVGRRVLQGLVDSGEVVVRAGSRRPEERADLDGLDVEVVELDFYLTHTFDAAVEGVDRIFLQAPPAEPDAYRTLIPFLDWAVQAGAHRIVNLSAMGVEELDELALRRVEKHLEGLGVEHTLLRPNWFMQNYHPGILSRMVREEGRIPVPVGEAPVSMVDVRDVAAVAVAALTEDRHAGRAYTLTGPEALTQEEAAAVLTEAWGREIRYEPVPEEEMERLLRNAGWGAGQAELMMGLFEEMRRGARTRVTSDVADVLGRPAVGLARYAREHADAVR